MLLRKKSAIVAATTKLISINSFFFSKRVSFSRAITRNRIIDSSRNIYVIGVQCATKIKQVAESNYQQVGLWQQRIVDMEA